jgi:hypothetical protein
MGNCASAETPTKYDARRESAAAADALAARPDLPTTGTRHTGDGSPTPTLSAPKPKKKVKKLKRVKRQHAANPLTTPPPESPQSSFEDPVSLRHVAVVDTPAGTPEPPSPQADTAAFISPQPSTAHSRAQSLASLGSPPQAFSSPGSVAKTSSPSTATDGTGSQLGHASDHPADDEPALSVYTLADGDPRSL